MEKFISISFLLGFILICFQSIQVNAQMKMMCGDGLLKAQMERNYPGYNDVLEKTFEDARARAITPYRGQPVYTIPVVVHVVWKEEEENLHDSIIINQIEVLNEDFRRLNADAGNLRAIFADRVGDPGIEFELVAIERVQTNAEFTPTLLGLPDQLKISEQGGSDAWDTERYMNLWVCKIQPLSIFGVPLGQVLGYAYPPADLDNWPEGASAPSPEVDGVVVDYRIFGRNNSLKIDPGIGDSISGFGRTAVHEIGHYLGLRHIWGDALFGDGCAVDDGVDDTPNQEASSNWACDTTANTCIDTINDLPDMIENYMDYSDERCMNSFTLGQIAIMRAVLEGPRSGLIEPISTVRINYESVRISLYPNPSSNGSFQLSIGGIRTGDLMVEVFDGIGKMVYQRSKLDSLEKISLENTRPGLYFVRISNIETGHLIATEKLLIH
ncbi:MAG: T9SS C-terminal target domain-containing protein [Saprospirales bacterium]|nr:MAG: T9SS C-terminal target domain-containing protein [Saprospirales bacterium]